MDELKIKATEGFIWSALDKFGVRILQFVIGVFLARLLFPKDFGLIGMLSVFIGISQAFIDGGMASGLIQKQDRTDLDYSTVFVFNLGVSVVIYAVLFFCAPVIAQFYDQPKLIVLTRVFTLNIVISALTIVQRTRLAIALDFKRLAQVNLLSSVVGGLVGVVMAYYDFGVWSLVGQTLGTSLGSILLIRIIARWSPGFTFAWKSFKQLFTYGSRLLVAEVYAKFMQEVYNIIIGKAYAPSQLGYYTNARSLTKVAAESITNVISEVSFPLLSGLQNEKQRMVEVYRRMIRMSAFLIIPVMVMITILAEPIVILLLTEKWRPVIPLLQWLVFARIFFPMGVINLNLLKAIGRSDWFLKVDLAKFPLLVLSIVITVPLGVKAIIIGQVVVGFLSFLINAYLPGKHFNYGALKQLKDMLPTISISVLMAFFVLIAIRVTESLLVQLVLGISIGAISYLSLALLTKSQELRELKFIGRMIWQRIFPDK